MITALIWALTIFGCVVVICVSTLLCIVASPNSRALETWLRHRKELERKG